MWRARTLRRIRSAKLTTSGTCGVLVDRLRLSSAPEECPEAHSLIRLVGSWRRVHECVGRFFSPDEYEAAAIGRQEDLLVYFALSHFGRRRPYSQLPDRLQRDVQFFFGRHA